MYNQQPYHLKAAQGPWQHMLTTAFAAALMMWLPSTQGHAAITDTVVASGKVGTQQISASATANVTVVPANPQLLVVKTGTLPSGSGTTNPGDIITYTFQFTNTGNVTLQNITMTDAGATLSGTSIATLAPNDEDTTTFSAQHTVTAADLAQGQYTNTAIVHAHGANGQDITTSAVAKTPLNLVTSMTFKKTGTLNLGSNGRADVGDTISYSFVVTNTSTTDLHNVKISDPLVNLASLANDPRAFAMLEGAKQIADNTAVGAIDKAGTAPFRQCTPLAAISSDISSNLVPQDLNSLLDDSNLNVVRQVVRMSGTSEQLAVGDKLGFIYGLHNTGNSLLSNIIVDQPDAQAFSARVESLAVNASDAASIIFTREVTAEEIAAGQINAPATISAKGRGHAIIQLMAEGAAVSAVKPYDSFTAATISPATVAVLGVNQSTTFTAIYTLTQLDIDSGVVNNTATATAMNVADQTITKQDSFSQTLTPAPGIALVKTGILNLGADNAASVGDVITYKFDITNTGNVTMSNVSVSDATPGVTVVGAPIASIKPGETKTGVYSATHSLVQADLDAGQFTNQASVQGTPPSGATVAAFSDNAGLINHNPTVVTMTASPKIALLKKISSVTDANNNNITDKGDIINYAFDVTNTGNVKLTNILVTDTSLPNVVFNTTTPMPSLAAGAVDTSYFTASHVITQADVDLGHVSNTAKVEGTAPGPVQVIDYSDPGVNTQDAPTVLNITPVPIIGVVKQVTSITDTNNNNTVDANDVIHYSFAVTNLGNVTLHGITVSDPLVTVLGGPLATLIPGDTKAGIFTASYKITSADVTAGRVTNQATATAFPPIGSSITGKSDNTDPSQHNPTVTAILPQPAIALIKSVTGVADTNNDGLIDAGDTITYSLAIKNTGNQTLTSVNVTDPNALVTSTLNGPLPSLPAGTTNTTTFSAAHIITPTEMAVGQVVNQATAHGTAPNLAAVSDPSDFSSFAGDAPTVTLLSNTPRMGVVKKFVSFADKNNNGLIDANDEINYAFTIYNTGNVPLTGITLIDNNGAVTGGPLANLGVGTSNSTTFTAIHTITNTDILAGGVSNQAQASGFTASAGTPVSDFSDPSNPLTDGPTFTPLAQVAKIALVLKVSSIDDVNGSGVTDPGDVIHYAYEITNIGNVPLTGITISDPGFPVIGGPLLSLGVGAVDSGTFTSSHLVTAADALAGKVINSAVVSGLSPSNASVSDTSDSASILADGPTITPVSLTKAVLTKTAAKSEVKRGETILYTITASNLSGVPYQLDDIMPPGFNFVAGSALINGIAATPLINARNLDFPSALPASGKLVLTLKLLASSTLSTGKFVNNAQLINPADGTLQATAQATVTIVEDSTFDCSDIIGRVFDDQNANGYMDDGEPGLPGVRVVSLNGLLVTTDADGRYHVPCAAIPDAAVGSNFLMKLDTRTLPTGYKLTTENPRDVRVTRGKVVKLNFGVAKRSEVRLDISDKAFMAGGTDLTDKWVNGIDKLLKVLGKRQASLKIVYHTKREDQALAEQRLAAVHETIATAWQIGGGTYKLAITTSVEAVQ